MNHTPKSIKAIQAAITIAKAAHQERRLNIAEDSHAFRFHPVNNPAVHWSGVSQRTLDILRANRVAVIEAGGSYYGQTGTAVRQIELGSYYNPRLAPAVGSLVSHDRYGLGIVESHPSYSSRLGMTVGVFFEEADRATTAFCDELAILEGNLRGATGVPDETIASKAERVNLDSARVEALRARYSPEEAEQEEKEDAAFGQFMADEFEAEVF